MHEQSNEVFGLLESGGFDELDALAARMRRNKETFASGDWKLRNFYSRHSGNLDYLRSVHGENYEDQLKEWIRKYPESPTPRIFLAQFHIDRAWKARGTTFASGVSDEGWKTMRSEMRQARDILNEADALEEQDPQILVEQLRVALLLDADRAYYKKIVNRANQLRPLYLRVYMEASIRFVHRWGGRDAELEAFAARVADETQDVAGDGMYAVIAESTLNYEGEESFLSDYKFSWPRIRQGALDLFARNPDSLQLVNRFALIACLYGDRETAALWLDRLGNDRLFDVWGPDPGFENWKAWAHSPDDRPSHLTAFLAAQYGILSELRRWIDSGGDIDVRDENGGTPLIRAVEHRNRDVAVYLMDAGADVTARTETGTTAAHAAASNGMAGILEPLAAHGADINAPLSEENSNTPLVTAVRSWQAKVVTALLELGADPDLKGKSGWAPLIYAAHYGQEEVVRDLLSHGADPDITNNAIWTPLVHAINKDHRGIVRLLVDAGADINLQRPEGPWPLGRAANRGHTELARYLLEHGAKIEGTNPRSYSPLMRAIYSGHYETARLLLDRGADVNYVATQSKLSPLLVAAEKNLAAIIPELIQGGADTAHINRYRQNALHKAAQMGNLEATRILVESGKFDLDKGVLFSGATARALAAQNGHSEIVRYLDRAKKGGGKDRAPKDPPLFLAASKGDLTKVRSLLKKGASVDGPSSIQWTPLMIAVSKGHKPVARELLKRGADPNYSPAKYPTRPLLVAVKKRNADMVSILIEAGAETDFEAGTYGLPFYVAQNNGDIAILRLLFEAGADPNRLTQEGYASLHRAVFVNNVPVVKYLLSLDSIDVNIQDISGYTVLHYSADANLTEIAELLISSKADITIKSFSGHSAIDAARLRGHTKLVRIFEDYENQLRIADPDGIGEGDIDIDPSRLSTLGGDR